MHTLLSPLLSQDFQILSPSTNNVAFLVASDRDAEASGVFNYSTQVLCQRNNTEDANVPTVSPAAPQVYVNRNYRHACMCELLSVSFLAVGSLQVHFRSHRGVFSAGQHMQAREWRVKSINFPSVIRPTDYGLKKQQKKTQLVSWCFEPSQPLRITSGLNNKTNKNNNNNKKYNL